MPKIKTLKGAAKRFKVTGSGRLKRFQSSKSHLLTKKPAKRKRALRKADLVSPADVKRIRKLIPYA